MANLIPFNRRGFDVLGTTFADFQNMLDDFFAEGWPFRRSLLGDTFKVDVQDNKTEYVVEAELPGVQKNEVSVTMDDGRLNISVNRVEDVEQKDKNYIHRERRVSSMSRNIYLADADSSGIKAKLENGVLCITVPKKKGKADNTVVIDVD